jgi:hypothetical protein
VGLGSRRTTTDAYGTYQLDLEAGAAIDADLALYAASPGWYPEVVAGFGARLLALSEGALTQDLRLARESETLSGRVVDAAGAPQTGVYVYPWRLATLTDRETAEDLAAPQDTDPLSLTGNLVRAFARTDAEGRFRVAGLDRRPYAVRLYARDAGWAWTAPELVGGAQDVELRLPPDLLGPVSGMAVTRDGAPAAGVGITAFVEVYATGGGVAAAGLPVRATTDAAGAFRIERMPRHGVFLTLGGPDWVPEQCALDPTRTADLRVVLLRRCHVRVHLMDPAWSRSTIRFLDAQDQVLQIHEERAGTRMTRDRCELHDGKTEVLAVSEAAATLLVQSPAGKEQRFPVALRPGEVNALVR